MVNNGSEMVNDGMVPPHTKQAPEHCQLGATVANRGMPWGWHQLILAMTLDAFVKKHHCKGKHLSLTELQKLS